MSKYQAPTKEFFRLPNNVFDPGLTLIQFTLYSYLVSCAGSKSFCWPSQNIISAKASIGTTSVQDHLKILGNRQIIDIGNRCSKSGHWNNASTLLSLGNPEVYREIDAAAEEFPLFIGEDLPS